MKIVIACGGTLGHLTPILPIIELLNLKGNKVILYTTKKQVVSNFLEMNNGFDEIKYYETKGLSKKILKVLKTNLKAYRIIKSDLKIDKPDIVIGMGGYISGIVIRAASKQNIKTIIYEQNSVLGTANKWCLRYVDKIIHSYKELNIGKKFESKKIFLINPRQEYARLQIPFYRPKENHILVTSGSLGSEKINEVILDVAKKLPNYQFTIVSGNHYYEKMSKCNLNNLKVIASTTNLIKYILESNIIISRAGATTISEIIGCNRIGIFIPSPNVTANHQMKNTFFITENNIGIVIKEESLSADNLLKVINEISQTKKTMLERIEQFNQETSIERFANIIINEGK